MKHYLYIVLFTFLTLQYLNAEFKQSTIDTVINYHWGSGQNVGQDTEYFPMNIFGRPDSTANENFPSSDPKEICSIGLSGEITLSFKNFDIIDGPGPDFTIFENAFINPVTKKIFAEPAVISVSMDGINFFSFSFDSLTLRGCAGITPTNGNKDCYNPDESGGDKFDLAEIGLERVRYIRIKDISSMLLENPEHPFYDPIISGFDLDAVVGLNLANRTSTTVYNNSSDGLQLLVNGTKLLVTSTATRSLLYIYNLAGQRIEEVEFSFSKEIDLLKSGLYFIIVVNNKGIIRRKVFI